MLTERTARLAAGMTDFVRTDLSLLLAEHGSRDPTGHLLALFRRTAASVPAYAAFLRGRGIDPSAIRSLEDFRGLPLLTKESYLRACPLPELCRGGELSACDMVAVSSGSTGEPAFWPRFQSDELAVAARFEQAFHDSFEADRRRTLAVVCFPLGTWVGGMFTASCCRHLATKGYPVTVVTPGNNKPEILRVVRALSPLFEQTVLLGYPPFLKDVVDAGRDAGLDWARFRIKLVLAGEVFSEEWRALMAERAGMTRPLRDSVSLYGTADAGVLGNETPLTLSIRRYLAEHPDVARELFGEARLPTLVQYDPWERFFETHEGTLAFTGDGGVPLVRYHISDTGGVVDHETLLARLKEFGFDARADVLRDGTRGLHPLPFAYVFGRSHFAVSFYGANVFPDTVTIAFEQPDVREHVTGKFVLEVREDAAQDQDLWIAVELARGDCDEAALTKALGDGVVTVLRRLNSEFANYVPAERQRPRITLWPPGHPEYFPAGVKHRYSRR